MTTTQDERKERALKAYHSAHFLVADMLREMTDMLGDFPTGEEESDRIDWGHVGSMNAISSKLQETMEAMAELAYHR